MLNESYTKATNAYRFMYRHLKAIKQTRDLTANDYTFTDETLDIMARECDLTPAQCKEFTKTVFISPKDIT
jgi:hypothetical protein